MHTTAMRVADIAWLAEVVGLVTVLQCWYKHFWDQALPAPGSWLGMNWNEPHFLMERACSMPDANPC